MTKHCEGTKHIRRRRHPSSAGSSPAVRATGAATAAAMLFLGCGSPGGVPGGGGGGSGALESAVRGEITPEGLAGQVDSIVQYNRLSGSPGEFAAIDHIVATLSADGVPVTVDTLMAYISDPVSARVELVGTGFAPPAITVAGSGSTSNLQGPVVDLGSADDLPDFLTSTGESLVLDGRGPATGSNPPPYPDLRGRIALVTGTPGPDEVTKVAALGAAGAVFVNPEELLNDLTTTTVWGGPSLRDYQRIPTLPVAEVKRSDGDRIRQMLAGRPGSIRMSVETKTGWKELRLVTAHVPGPTPDAPFVLAGGHLDSWYYGGTDNGGANAAMVELTRAFYKHRDRMKRGLVMAWWPGHSNGRYAGSTWYVDHHFDQLRRRAVAYVNFEGLGQMKAKRFSAATTASLAELARSVVQEGVGDSIRPRPPGRNSDQSFNGVGLPLLQISHSITQEDGGYWWWHTPDDTRDKVDSAVLATDADLYGAALSRLLAEPNLPVDVAATVERLGSLIEAAQAQAGNRLDLSEAMARQRALLEEVRAVESSLPARGDPSVDLARLEILRPLHRVLYTLLGPYHPDPATDEAALPGLKPVEMLSSDASGSDRYHFAETTLLRENARLLEALDRATDTARRLRAQLGR